MRRSHDHLAAADRHPDRPAFSTPSPRQGLMKHTSSFRPPLPFQRSHPPCVSLGPRYTLFFPPSLPIQVDLRSPSSHFGLPPQPQPFPLASPCHREAQPPFKPHSLVPRLRSNGCIESAPSAFPRSSRLFRRRASDTALTFRSKSGINAGKSVLTR